LGKSFEGLIALHNMVLPPDVVDVMVKKLCLSDDAVLVPTNKIIILAWTF